MNQLQQGFRPGEWYVMDRTKKVAIIKLITMRSGRKVLRAVTWHENPDERQLLGYVGERDRRRDGTHSVTGTTVSPEGVAREYDEVL